MIKEIVEFMDLEGGKFRDIILENRAIAKGLHIIVDKDTFEIKEFAYNDGSDEFIAFAKKYDLKKREYYCNYLDSNKNFDNSPAEGKNQIHSASPYAIFFRFKNNKTILQRLLEIKKRINITGYFEKLRSLTKQKDILVHLKNIKQNIKSKFATKYFIKKIGKENLRRIKNNDYLKIYFDFDMKYIKSFYDEYTPQMSFNKKGLFEDKESYTTSKQYYCPATNEKQNLGISDFLNTFADKKIFLKHLTRDKIYGGFSALYSGKIIQKLSIFEELLKLGLLPNPLPIFVSSKDAIDNEGNRVYFDLLKNSLEPIKYKDIIKKVYEKMANNDSEISELNFYLIFWKNTKAGLVFYDVDYIDGFQYKLKDFEIKDIFSLKIISGNIDNIFDLEWQFFSKFFYTVKDEQEKTYLLQNNYFAEKIDIYKGEKLPAMVATKFYQYNKTIFDYIYKGKREVITGYMFDDICISIIREQIKLNSDWDDTYKIKEKLTLYLSLYKNFHKGEDLGTKIKDLQESIEKLIEDDELHLEKDEEFAFASGQLIWFILSKNESSSKTHSLLDIFISKNRLEDYKLMIAEQLRKYAHAFKFYNEHGWFDKLVSEVMGYESRENIKKMIPLIMAGYFSKNIIKEKLKEASSKKKGDDNNE